MGAGAIVAGIVRFDTDDFSIPDKKAYRAAAAAVHVAGGPDGFFVGMRCGQLISLCVVRFKARRE